jgi:hypothetical protein
MGQHTLTTALTLTIATILSQRVLDIVSEISADVSNLRSGGLITLFGRSRHHSTKKIDIKSLLPGSK